MKRRRIERLVASALSRSLGEPVPVSEVRVSWRRSGWGTRDVGMVCVMLGYSVHAPNKRGLLVAATSEAARAPEWLGPLQEMLAGGGRG